MYILGIKGMLQAILVDAALLSQKETAGIECPEAEHQGTTRQ